MTFRFLHTADWQIGKPFGSVPGDAGADLRGQRLRTVGRIAALAREHAVDAVLVAGDAFDSNDVTDKTAVLTLEALKAFEGPWIFLPGNHDPALAHSIWTRLRALGAPANVVIADTPTAIDRWDGRAQVLPAPLRRRREALDQTEWFDAAATPDGSLRIGLAHGSVAGLLPGTAEAANEIPHDRAERAGLHYLALGDWHGLFRVGPRTFYSGTPETDRHRANKSGHLHLIEIDGPGAPTQVTEIEVGHYRWDRLDVDLQDGTCTAALDALENLGGDPRRSVVSLHLSGSVSLSERDRLMGALAGWEARLHHLHVDDGALRDEPTDDDLDAIDTAGFVRMAVDRLRARAADVADPERDAAAIALRMMYLDHMGR